MQHQIGMQILSWIRNVYDCNISFLGFYNFLKRHLWRIDSSVSSSFSLFLWQSKTSSSSSCHAISTDIRDPLSPPLPIVHCFRQVLRATAHIGRELLYVGSSWSSSLCTSMWRGPQEYITYELVPNFPAVSCKSGSSNFDTIRITLYWAMRKFSGLKKLMKLNYNQNYIYILYIYIYIYIYTIYMGGYY